MGQFISVRFGSLSAKLSLFFADMFDRLYLGTNCSFDLKSNYIKHMFVTAFKS